VILVFLGDVNHEIQLRLVEGAVQRLMRLFSVISPVLGRRAVRVGGQPIPDADADFFENL
jgi:hypothetical protein